MRFNHFIEKEIVAIRVRINWRGRPILQCQRAQYRVRHVEELKTILERHGNGAFRDAARDDALDVYEFISHMTERLT